MPSGCNSGNEAVPPEKDTESVPSGFESGNEAALPKKDTESVPSGCKSGNEAEPMKCNTSSVSAENSQEKPEPPECNVDDEPQGDNTQAGTPKSNGSSEAKQGGVISYDPNNRESMRNTLQQMLPTLRSLSEQLELLDSELTSLRAQA